MRPSSLRTKSVSVLGLVIVLSVILNFGVLNFLVYPSFIELEQVETKRNLKRTQDAIRNELSHLSTFVWDWAAWDDTYAFIKNPNQGQKYIDSNLTESVFSGNFLNLILFYNNKGKLAWGQIYDLATKKKITLEEIPSIAFSPKHSLLKHTKIESAPAGVMLTNRGPMLIASRPIVTSDQEGPIQGTVVMGKFLTGPVIKRLKEQVQAEFQIWPLNERPSSPNEQKALAQLERGNKTVLRETGEDVLSAYSLLLDSDNKSTVLLRADTPRVISTMGIETLKVALLGIIGTGLISLTVMAALQSRLVTGPLIQLTDHVLAIGSTGDLSQRLDQKRSDEIGTLALEFDGMLENLSDARRRLLEQSHNSGMAEMASGILHNIRNQLTPIVLLVGRLTTNLATVPGSNAGQAVAELASDATSAERREKLGRYMNLVVEEFVDDRKSVAASLRGLAETLGRVDEILTHHEAMSHSERAVESIRLSDILEDALKTVPCKPSLEIMVQMDPEIAELGSVRAERVLLFQILENVLRNAEKAIENSGGVLGEIHISAVAEQHGEQEMIHLQIRDNGEGIEAETLSRIFERGFTTKPEGKGGLGLHWCANSMASIGGQIFPESEGLGLGATFHILIPAQKGPTLPQDAGKENSRDAAA